MNKSGSELTLNTIIVTILVLIVLVILILIFSGGAGKIGNYFDNIINSLIGTK